MVCTAYIRGRLNLTENTNSVVKEEAIQVIEITLKVVNRLYDFL